MLRLVAILALVIGTVAGVPAIRAIVLPPLEPVLEKVGLERKVVVPIKSRRAETEVRGLLQMVAQAIKADKDVPTPSGFTRWIRTSTKLSSKGIDPWGRPYYLSDSDNRLTVGSNGPDRKRNTRDDISITVPYK